MSVSWDENRARSLIGKYVLIGVTHLAADGETVTGQSQFHGVVRAVDPTKGIAVECRGSLTGQIRNLPPDLSNFNTAPVGDYRLGSNGEVVVNPDFIATWGVVEKKDDN